MSQIDQFSDNQSYSVNDFQDNATSVPVTSLGSNKNLAAHAAVLSPDPNESAQAYSQVVDEMNVSGDSPTANALITNAKGENLQGYRRSAAETMMDPAAGDEWKKSVLDVVNNPASEIYNMRTMVATQAAMKPNQNETQEASIQRGIGAAAITQVMNYNRMKQQYYNELQQRQDGQKAAPYVSAAEDFVPLAYGYKQARVNADLLGADATTARTAWDAVWSGNTAADRRDWFNKIPLDQRMQAMDKVMDTISSNGSTILLPDDIDNSNLKVFRDTVESGSYTTTDQTIDNVLGLLDVVGIGGLLRGASKVIRGGAEAAEGAADVGRATGPIPRRPSPTSDWRTGEKREPGTFNQDGADSYAVGFPTGEELATRSWGKQFVITDVQPTSLSQTVKDANPEQARALHMAATKDETGDVAGAVYGAGREDAIAHDISPQPANVGGAVQSKVFHPERDGDFEFMPNGDLLDFVDNSGASWLTPSEKRGVRAAVSNDFLNATGMVNRKEMTSIDSLDDGVSFKAVYGPSDSGWSNSTAAIDQAKYALKEYGITEDNISILTRQGDNYTPIPFKDLESAGDIGGDFLLQIDHKYKFNTADVERDGFEALDVANNWIDRWLPGGGDKGAGTINSAMFDPQSMFRPELTRGATTAGLRGARLEQDLMKVAVDYTKQIKNLPKVRQQKVFSKIREGNAKGQSFNYANLRAEGFKDSEIKALATWKETQDTIYAISNRDMVKTYRARGYGVMEHQPSGTRLFVKPIARNQVGDSIRAYDPVSDSLKTLTKDDLTTLYASNGRVAATSNPVTVQGETISHVLDHNAVGSNYIRTLKDTDTVLNYRKGYYAVRYKDQHFIEQKVKNPDGTTVKDSSGNDVWKAVATAANSPDAEKAVKRMTTTTGGEYRWRNDLRGEDFDAANASSMQAGGMSSQRLRGQRLEDSTGQPHVSEATNIQSPIESMINSIQSVSNRVTSRDWIETAKRRFVSQYGDVLPKKQGMVQFPRTRGEIGEAGKKTSKQAADARSTWEYIRQIENGYVNSIDDGYKALMNGVADWMGHKGFGITEQALRGAAVKGPTSVAKGAAFSLYLAANPLRQFLIQSHQLLMLGSTFPRYTFTHLADDQLLMLAHRLGADPSPMLLKAAGRTLDESRAMYKALDASNIGAGITKHELVRESLGSIADEASAARRNAGLVSKAFSPITRTLAVSRKVGFDAGEYLSSSASFLAHYDEAIRAGRTIGPEAIEELTAKSRNFVYNMDKAGALPYNHNALAIVTQFLQVPHKAILQFTFNRGLSSTEKTKIAAYMITMFGTTALTGITPGVGNVFESYLRDLLPDDPEYRDGILNGIETVFLNKLFTRIYGEPVSLDYSSLAPLDTYGVSEFISSVIEEGPLQVFAASPSGSLIMGTNPRITNLMNSLSIMTGLKSNYEQNPVKWSNVAMDAANLFSGTSNAFKAAYALEYGRKIGALGGISDSNVNSFEAIATALGLQTQDETKMRKASDVMYKSQEAFDNDVKAVFQGYAKVLSQDGITADQMEYATEMAGQAMSSFKGNPRALQVWNAEMKKQQTNKDYRFINKLLEMCSWAKADDVKSLIDKAPNMTPEKRLNLKAVCDYNLDYRPDLKDTK